MSLALQYWMRGAHHCSGPPVSEMTYILSSGTLKSTIPYHTCYTIWVIKIGEAGARPLCDGMFNDKVSLTSVGTEWTSHVPYLWDPNIRPRGMIWSKKVLQGDQTMSKFGSAMPSTLGTNLSGPINCDCTAYFHTVWSQWMLTRDLFAAACLLVLFRRVVLYWYQYCYIHQRDYVVAFVCLFVITRTT